MGKDGTQQWCRELCHHRCHRAVVSSLQLPPAAFPNTMGKNEIQNKHYKAVG